MLFNSYVFLIFFLPITLLGYYVFFRSCRLQFLTLMSYIFYGWWDVRFLPLLWISTVLDYEVGRRLGLTEDPRRRRRLVLVSIIGNLGILGFFKYFRLAAETANFLAGRQLLPAWHIVLPVGISFYTFQTLSYSIDVYRRQIQPARNFKEFCWYVAFFPQLVAGPIVRYSDLESQLRYRNHSVEKFAQGCSFIVVGLAKKVLLADTMAMIADPMFNSSSLAVLDCWLGVLAYYLQIYFDFSGYSDMAVGLGLLFGFEFKQNFNSPYQSKSIREFWTRWHISLSTWLRDYLYIPLGGNRKGIRRTFFNLALTMLLGGLWHGAQWTFVVWGAYHGLLLAVERLLGDRNPVLKLPESMQRLACQMLVLVGWVFFRCNTVARAADWLRTMVGLAHRSAVIYAPPAWLFLAVAGCLAVTQCCRNTFEIHWVYTPQRAILMTLLLGWCFVVILTQNYSPFLYFQF